MNLIAHVARPVAGKLFPALLLMLALLAASVPSASAAEGKRFLFIVDASTGMKPFELTVRQAIFDLIYSGVRGAMTNGDTYGVWLVGEKNDTSFPMESWKEKFAVEIAAKAVSHAKDHGLRGRANLTLAFADVNRIVKNVGDLTVILISNGETPLLGTPFDDAINARFRELAPTMKAAKATLNTVLVAQDGKFVAWAANSPQFLVEVPYVAPKLKPVKTEPVAVAPAVAKAAPVKVAAPAPPRVAANPIIITKESVAEERRSYAPATTAVAVPAPTTNMVAAATNTAATNIVTTALTNLSNSAVVAVSAPVNPVTNSSPTTNAAGASVETKPANVAAVTPVVVASPTPPAPTGSRLGFVFLCAGAGAGGAFLIVLAVLLFNRSQRREPSLISQAIARERAEAR